MNDSTIAPTRNPFADLLSGMVADAHFELGTAPAAPTALGVFLGGMVATAAVDLERATPSFPYRPDGVIYHQPAAIHGDIDAELVRLIQENGAVGDTSFVDAGDVSPTAPNIYVPPVATREYWCVVDTKAKRRTRSDGQQVKTMYRCRKCGPCLRWWRLRIRHKYEWAISGQPEQTIVTIRGLADDDAASEAAIAVGRAGDGQRLVSVVRNPLTYHWDALIAFTSPATDRVILNVQRGRDRAGQDCAIETRGFTGAELVADWLPVNGRTPGWHKPCRLVGWDAPGVEPEYQYSDGYIIDAADAPDIPFENIAPIDLEIHGLADRPTDTNANRRAKLRARNRVHIRRWLAGVELDADALLTLKRMRLDGQRGDWLACIASGTYDGPKRLLIDLARVLDDGGLVSMDAPDGLRLAASYIVDGVAV